MGRSSSTTRRAAAFTWLLLALAALTLWAPAASAFHFPWDQGHDTFNPDHGDDTDPGDDGPNECGSPVEVSSGNYVFSFPLVSIPSYGPGIELSLTYNSKDLRQGPLGRGWTHSYDQRVVKTTDEVNVYAICGQDNGKRERFVRSADGSYTAPAHVRSTMSEQADGSFEIRQKDGVVRRFAADTRLLEVRDPNGNSLTFGYDSAGFLVSVTDVSGRTVVFTKGSDGRISSITDPKGHAHQFSYDAAGNFVGLTDPDGEVIEFRYDSAGRMREVVDALGHSQTSVTYDSTGRVRTHREAALNWTYSYNSAARRTTKTDSTGRSYTYEYTSEGNITRVIDPFGNSERFVYDGSFNVIERTSERGQVMRATYDSSGNPLTLTDALGVTRSMTYEPNFNRIASVTNGAGETTTYQYDTRGNLIRSTDPAGNATVYEYDAVGRVIRVTDPTGSSSTISYDAHGNMVQVTDALGNTSTATYDLMGQILSATDPLGNTIEYTYDDKDRRLTERAADGGLVQYAYDAASNLTSITTPDGNTTLFEYDAYNRLQRVVDAAGGEATYGYDARGNLITATDQKGQSVTMTYDVLDRMLTKVKPDDTVTYSYDATGNLLSVADGDSSVTYVYDAGNQILETRTAATAGQPASLVRFEYDDQGRRTRLIDPQGGIQSYDYDDRSRLSRITDPAGNVFDFTYDAYDRRTALTLGPAGSVSWSLDAASRVTSVDHGGTQVSYGYDAAANRTTIIDSAGSHSFTFDPVDRLLSATHPGGGNESYAYDLMGNRVSSHLSSAYVYDPANRLLADDSFVYSYDANGNLTSKQEVGGGATTTYTYDSEDRLVRVDLPNGDVASYRYDGLGRRIAKELNGQSTQYVYDQYEILVEYQAGAAVARYTHGPEQDEILAVRRGGASYFFEWDALGSVRRVVDAAGTEVASYTYDSFGRLLTETGSPQAPFLFQGRELDRETGLYFFRSRYYDPEVGRFITEDPIGFRAGLNFYAFVDNNPLAFTDPFGLDNGWWDFVPIIGSGMRAYQDFSCGRWGWGLFNTAMAISDVFLVKSLATSVGRAVFKTGLRRGMSRPNAAFPRGIERVEMSHWIPSRWLPDSMKGMGWNLKPMWGTDHALADPKRYQFLRKWWKQDNPLPNPVTRQLNRVPNGVQGVAAGAASAGGRAANGARDNDCQCQ